MIQCEICKCWQHCICMGLQTEEDCPDVYFCEQCKPEMHVVLLRQLGFLPAASSSSSSRNKKGGSASAKATHARELREAKEAVARMTAENARRLKQQSEWAAREAAHQFAAARKSGRAPQSVLEAGSVAAPGAAPVGAGGVEMTTGASTAGSASGERRQRSTSRMGEEGDAKLSGSASANNIAALKSPKRRSTMNSRDSAYGWEPIPAGLLNADEVWDGPLTEKEEARRLKDKKRKREDASTEDEEEAEPYEAEDDGTEASKRRKTAAVESGAESKPSRPKSGARGKQPNQYTYRNKEKEKVASSGPPVATNVGSNALGLTNSSASSPSPTKRGRNNARDASSVNGTPAPVTPASLWGLPEHLSHLEHLLPNGTPDELHLHMTSTKGVTARNQANDPNPPEGAASPQPFQLLDLVEARCKIRFPGRRSTMGEMRKRVRNIAEYITQTQLEAVEREKRMRKLGVQVDHTIASGSGSSSVTVTPAEPPAAGAADAAPADAEMQDGTTEAAGDGVGEATSEKASASAPSEDATVAKADAEEGDEKKPEPAAEPAADAQPEVAKGDDAQAPSDAPAAEAQGSATPQPQPPKKQQTQPSQHRDAIHMLDELMREVIAWQQKFGALPGGLASALYAQSLQATPAIDA